MGPAISHLIQTFRFAHDLKARSHVVTVASPESYLKPIVESNGLPFYHLSLYDDLSLPPSDRWRRQRGESQTVWKRLLPQPRLRARTERQQLFRSLFDGSAHRSMMDALRPDLILFECSWEGVAALPLFAWKLPMIQVSPVLPSDKTGGSTPPMSSHLIPSPRRLSRYRCRLEWARENLLNHNLNRLARFRLSAGLSYRQVLRLLEHHGISAGEALGTPELILCPAAFDFPRAANPGRYFVDNGVYTEHCTEDATAGLPLGKLSANKPIVFCSFGTRLPASRRAARLLRKIIKAFSNQRELQLVVCVRQGSDDREFAWAADSVIVVSKWISQITLLRRASVYITHGGFSSVREGIEAEVPMIVIPFDSDQPGNAARVVYHELGVRVFPGKVVGPQLVEMAKQLSVSTNCRTSLRRMKREFDLQRATQSAADLIESFLPAKTEAFGQSI